MADQAVASGESLENFEIGESSDERLAALVHLQQLQQKQEVVQRMESETAANADAGFRRGLEELVRDHLNTCMALASCNSAVLDPSSSGPNVMSRPSSYTSMHDESADTHHSLCENHNIMGSYDTDQSDHGTMNTYDRAQSHGSEGPLFEMSESAYHSACQHILVHEQSNNEHANANQYVEEQREADQRLLEDHQSTQEQPRSSILSIWAARHAQEMITTMERQTREAELLALAGLHTVSTLDASFLRDSLATPDTSISQEERQRRRPSSMVQMWREFEEERRNERVRRELEERMTGFSVPSTVETSVISTNTHIVDGVRQNVLEESETGHIQGTEDREGVLQSERADDTEWELNRIEMGMHEQTDTSDSHPLQTQEGEREHVRQIVQRLTTTDNGMQSDGETRRSSWLDENERERVRELAREWVRVTNEQGAVMQERGGRQRHQTVIRTEQSRAPPDESFNDSSVQELSRRERRFLNHQVILDMLMRVERERQRELQLLVEHRAVSDFAHRHRLQSFIRGRFLRTGAVSEEERVPSSAAGELGQLRQRRAVSDLREAFRFRLESILRNQVNNRVDADRGDDHGTSQRRRRRRRAEDQPNVQPSMGESPSRRRAPSEGISRGSQANMAPRRAADFQIMEESNDYHMELQELLGRRSVTNVLASEFRDRLDRLIRSFLQTQGRSPVAWDLARAGAREQQPQPTQLPPPPPRQQWDRHVQTRRPPPPPPPPPQPLWQQDLQQGFWPRQSPSLHRSSYLEGEGIADLRTDVSKLQQGMADLHRMMETCIEMQLDLQRSLRQELAGALQQMYVGKAIPEEAIDGSKWVSVKRGICCVCCDRNIDSLLYRCGHMCTCLNCASELIRKSGKCPMCRAPIKEVVRAFTVA